MSDFNDHPPAQVALLGSSGRMGESLKTLLSAHPHLKLAEPLDRRALADVDRARRALQSVDVIIDFTTAEAQVEIAELMLTANVNTPLVSGVTGIGGIGETWLARYAERAPVLWAANFSLGVAILKRISELTARALGREFDIELYELHHRGKLDAPSGTARALADAVCEGRRSAGLHNAHVSLEQTAPRDPDAIHVSAGRGGGVFGDHSVLFLGDSERLELKHSALNREVFARGALRAAEWCLGREPGLYSVEDLLER